MSSMVPQSSDVSVGDVIDLIRRMRALRSHEQFTTSEYARDAYAEGRQALVSRLGKLDAFTVFGHGTAITGALVGLGDDGLDVAAGVLLTLSYVRDDGNGDDELVRLVSVWELLWTRIAQMTRSTRRLASPVAVRAVA